MARGGNGGVGKYFADFAAIGVGSPAGWWVQQAHTLHTAPVCCSMLSCSAAPRTQPTALGLSLVLLSKCSNLVLPALRFGGGGGGGCNTDGGSANAGGLGGQGGRTLCVRWCNMAQPWYAMAALMRFLRGVHTPTTFTSLCPQVVVAAVLAPLGALARLVCPAQVGQKLNASTSCFQSASCC